MRKLLLALVLIPGLSYAGTVNSEFSGFAKNTDETVLAAAGPGLINCLDNIVFYSSASTNGFATYRILDGNTTNYQITVATTTAPIINPFIRPICGDNNTRMVIKSSATASDMSYKGHVERLNP